MSLVLGHVGVLVFGTLRAVSVLLDRQVWTSPFGVRRLFLTRTALQRLLEELFVFYAHVGEFSEILIKRSHWYFFRRGRRCD